MKFLFVAQPSVLVYEAPPQGLSIVATFAKEAGIDVSMLSARSRGEDLELFTKRMISHIREGGYSVVCFGGMSRDYMFLKRVFKLCREEGCVTILGGNIVDPTPELIAKNIGATYCVVGEGEETFKELAEALNRGLKGNELSHIDGLCYMHEGNLIKTNPRKVIKDLDTLPIIDFDMVGIYDIVKRTKTVAITGSRSCPYQCTFCYHLKGSHYRERSLDSIFKELDIIIEKVGYDNLRMIGFQDEMINVKKDRIMEFCKRIKGYGIKYGFQARLDYMDEEMLISLKDSNCDLVSYGVESANNRVLKSMRKNLTIEHINEKLDLTAKHGLMIQANIIIGDIEDDKESIIESITWAFNKSKIARINIDYISIFPGTHLYNVALERGIIKDELQFLEQSCPITNVTKVSDNEHKLLANKARLYQKAKKIVYDTPLNFENPHMEIEKNGIIKYVGYCPNCFERIEYKNIDRERDLLLDWVHEPDPRGCPKCFERLNLEVTRLIERNYDTMLIGFLSDQFFKKYVGSKIAVWGIGVDYMIRLIMESQTLRDCIVKIVDINHKKYEGCKFAGLEVEHPDVLKDVDIDYVIISAVRARGAIREELKRMNKSVKTIDITLPTV